MVKALCEYMVQLPISSLATPIFPTKFSTVEALRSRLRQCSSYSGHTHLQLFNGVIHSNTEVECLARVWLCLENFEPAPIWFVLERLQKPGRLHLWARINKTKKYMKIQQENIREYPKICEIRENFLSWTIPVIRYLDTVVPSCDCCIGTPYEVSFHHILCSVVVVLECAQTLCSQVARILWTLQEQWAMDKPVYCIVEYWLLVSVCGFLCVRVCVSTHVWYTNVHI